MNIQRRTIEQNDLGTYSKVLQKYEKENWTKQLYPIF